MKEGGSFDFFLKIFLDHISFKFILRLSKFGYDILMWCFFSTELISIARCSHIRLYLLSLHIFGFVRSQYYGSNYFAPP